MKKHRNLDTLLLLVFLLIAGTGIVLDMHIFPKGELTGNIKNVHIYLGYFMIACIALHLFLHRAWIRQAFRKGNN